MATVVETENDAVIDAEFTVIATNPVALYDVTDAAIDELRNEMTGIKIMGAYPAVVKGIAKVRGLRRGIEAARKRLKEDSLAWGRKVDSEAKRITELLEAIEEPLKLLKQKVDDEAEAAKAAAEAANRKKMEERYETFKGLEYSINSFLVSEMTDQEYRDELEIASVRFRDILGARVSANAKAEEERLAAIAAEAAKVEAMRLERLAIDRANTEIESERRRVQMERDAWEEEKARAARIDAERQAAIEETNRAMLAKMQADIDEAARVEREALRIEQDRADELRQRQTETLHAERMALKDELDRIAREDFARQARIQAEADEAERVAWEAKESAALAEHNARLAEQAERDRIEAELVEANRLREIAPDIEKLAAYADRIIFLSKSSPLMQSDSACLFISDVNDELFRLANDCRGWN